MPVTFLSGIWILPAFGNYEDYRTFLYFCNNNYDHQDNNTSFISVLLLVQKEL